MISVIVCTYNRCDLLPECLKSLADQTLEKNLYEVIVVNNNSTDNTQQAAEEFAGRHPNFWVVVETMQGLSHARNRGWQEARGQYAAFIDDDAKASPDWCERILDSFHIVEPKPVSVGGEIHPWYETKPPKWFADEFELRTWGEEKGFLKPPRAPYGFSGSNMAFPKDLLEKHGGFSPDYGMVGGQTRMGDETQLFLRIYEEKPYFWYDPQIKVFHWTPLRNMKATYRFMRAYKGGQLQAALDRRNIISFYYLKSWLGLFYFAVKMPLIILSFERKSKTELVKLIQQFGQRLGYLIGNIKG